MTSQAGSEETLQLPPGSFGTSDFADTPQGPAALEDHVGQALWLGIPAEPSLHLTPAREPGTGRRSLPDESRALNVPQVILKS